jgi:Sodium:neurotransmitter symporter family
MRVNIPQVILIFSILNNEHMLGEEYEYPDWAIPLGWVLTLSSVICIPLYMIYKFDKTRGGFKRVSLIFLISFNFFKLTIEISEIENNV